MGSTLGSKKVLSHCPRQVDFPSGQVTFIFTCPMGKGSGKSSTNHVIKTVTMTCSEGKQNLRATCPTGKLVFKFF